jgi:hypothetical protein
VGVIRVPWSDAPDDFAICLCRAGAEMRNGRNVKQTEFALWQLWAAREQIDPSRVFFLEEVLTPQELSERGFSMPARPTAVAREAALMAAGKSKRVKL